MSEEMILWGRFEKSGKITDYLAYCRKREDEKTDAAENHRVGYF